MPTPAHAPLHSSAQTPAAQTHARNASTLGPGSVGSGAAQLPMHEQHCPSPGQHPSPRPSGHPQVPPPCSVHVPYPPPSGKHVATPGVLVAWQVHDMVEPGTQSVVPLEVELIALEVVALEVVVVELVVPELFAVELVVMEPLPPLPEGSGTTSVEPQPTVIMTVKNPRRESVRIEFNLYRIPAPEAICGAAGRGPP